MPGATAILIVNGFDRKGLWGAQFDEPSALQFPWLGLCLREVDRRSKGSSREVLVWDNTQLPEMRDIARRHGARLLPDTREIDGVEGQAAGSRQSPTLGHPRALQRLWAEVGDDFDFVLTLDTDAFPIRDGWIETLHEMLAGAAVAGIWRDELSPQLEAFVHPSCLIARTERLRRIDEPFSAVGVQDVGQRITKEVLAAGERIAPLRRSNARNFHFLMGGIYGDLVYHHGAGSRAPIFRNSVSPEQDAYVYSRLREAVFEDVDRVVDVLTGAREDELGVGLTAVDERARP